MGPVMVLDKRIETRPSSMKSGLNIRLSDSVFRPGTTGGKVRARRGNGKPLYRVYLFLEGSDLPYVRQVTYVLHPTFRKQRRIVRRLASNPHCALPIWTWGLFLVTAIVEDKRGRSRTLRHEMSYDKELDGLTSDRYDFEES